MPSPVRSGESADLRSADVLADTRATLATFEDEVRSVIESVKMKSEATLRWLNEDAPHYWKTSSRQANEATAAARSALEICRQRTVAGHRSSCIEEKQAFVRCREREAFCGDQRVKTRSTATSLRQSVDELLTRVVQLERWLDGELPQLQGRLHKTAVAVAAYTATKPVTLREAAAASAAAPNAADEASAEERTPTASPAAAPEPTERS